MKKLLTAAALIATLSPSLQAETPQADASANETLAQFEDISGARFVWSRAAGWTLASPASESPVLTGHADHAPLAVFTDVPSGFRFVWTREGSWQFVGMADQLAAR
ncbi:MAG: hypothetical protein ACK4KV_21325 [Rhodocyclaceae bacterium]